MLKHALVDGIKNGIRSFWLSATAITVLTVSLASVVIVSTLSVTVGFAVRNLDTLVSFPAFFKDNVSEDRIQKEIIPQIQKISSIKDVKYFDRTAAQKLLEDGSDGLAVSFIKSQNGVGDNLAWRHILVTPDKSEDYGKAVAALKDDAYSDVWEEVFADQDFVNNLLRLYDWVRVIGAALIIVFALVSVLVMSNVLRMTIYNHREEIEIMRLVGGTNNYIRGPFIVQGIFYNFIAAVLVAAFFVPGISILAPGIKSWIGVAINTNTGDLIAQIYFSLILTIAISIAVGAATTYTAIQRYLKM